MNDNMIGARALMIALEKEGVKEVFGLPGGANLPMYDELYKSNRTLYAVRIGHYDDKADAQKVGAQIKAKLGINTIVITNNK